MRRVLLRSPSFGRDLRAWLKARPGSSESIEAALEQLAQDASAASLRTHKLRGALAGCWARSAGFDLRMVFDFVEHEDSEAILLLSLGTHDQVY